jgi:hypothetical protein
MFTCPNCGAENKLTATVCRLCETPLSAPASKVEARDAEQNFQEDAMDSNQPEGIACPTCNTMNELGWAFCQQCGSKLPQMAPSSAPTVVDSRQSPSLEQPTVLASHNMPNMPLGQPTVVDQSLALDSHQAGRPTVVDQSLSSQWPPPPDPPPARPIAMDSPIPLGQPTVPEYPPLPPPPSGQKSSLPPSGSTEEVQSMPLPKAIGGQACNKCGHQNAVGSAFCAGCGSPLSVAKTIVMSSVPAVAKGRLHLIMEGGQPGEIYELKDETIVGRVSGDISFPHDGFMSSRHARIVRHGNSFMLRDEGSRNGTFIKIKDEIELQPGDMILIGKQLFRFEV